MSGAPQEFLRNSPDMTPKPRFGSATRRNRGKNTKKRAAARAASAAAGSPKATKAMKVMKVAKAAAPPKAKGASQDPHFAASAGKDARGKPCPKWLLKEGNYHTLKKLEEKKISAYEA